jgi:hypothetical protein
MNPRLRLRCVHLMKRSKKNELQNALRLISLVLKNSDFEDYGLWIGSQVYRNYGPKRTG